MNKILIYAVTLLFILIIGVSATSATDTNDTGISIDHSSLVENSNVNNDTVTTADKIKITQEAKNTKKQAIAYFSVTKCLLTATKSMAKRRIANGVIQSVRNPSIPMI